MRVIQKHKDWSCSLLLQSKFSRHSFHFTRAPNGCQKLNEAIRQSLAAVGADVFVLSPGEFGAFAKAQIERWGVSIKKYGIRLEQ